MPSPDATCAPADRVRTGPLVAAMWSFAARRSCGESTRARVSVRSRGSFGIAAKKLTVERISVILCVSEFSIKEVCALADVTPRTIHFYIQQGLLAPAEGAGAWGAILGRPRGQTPIDQAVTEGASRPSARSAVRWGRWTTTKSYGRSRRARPQPRAVPRLIT